MEHPQTVRPHIDFCQKFIEKSLQDQKVLHTFVNVILKTIFLP